MPATVTEVPSSSNSPTTSAGPLAPLYSDPYAASVLKYPSDVGGQQKPHMVMFTALTNKPAEYDSTTDYSSNPAVNTPTGQGSGGVSGSTSLQGVSDVDEQTNLIFQPKRYNCGDVIALYMPDSISFAYSVGYSTIGMKDLMSDVAGASSSLFGDKGKVIAEIIKGAESTIESSTTRAVSATQGLAVNPQNQLLFDNIDFREYSMSFVFTPKNQQETDTVKNIIKTFRMHAAPKIQTGGVKAMMFEVPDSFIVQFVAGQNGRNQYITRVKESVLTNVTVNYAPNGIWTTFADGAPTQITMSLTFKEIALVDRTAISNGF